MEYIKVPELTGLGLPPEKINCVDEAQAFCETEKINRPSTSVSNGMNRSRPNVNFSLSLWKFLRIK